MTKNLIYLLSLIFVFALVSCEKDNNNEGNNGVSINTISAKWKISDSNSPYTSFEFNKDGNYIVVENVELNLRSSSTISKSSLFNSNSLRVAKTRASESESNLSPIHFGTYKIEGNKIILSGFGLIEVVSITAEEFTFSFTLEATGKKNNFVAGKAVESISSSSRTDMLCRTWIVDKVTIDFSYFSQENIDYYKDEYGDNWQNILEQEQTEKYQGICILISKAGTYLVLYDGEEGNAGLSEWKWANDQETGFYYSWNNWTDDWNYNIVTITDLKSTSLAIKEHELIWHLKLK